MHTTTVTHTSKTANFVGEYGKIIGCTRTWMQRIVSAALVTLIVNLVRCGLSWLHLTNADNCCQRMCCGALHGHTS